MMPARTRPPLRSYVTGLDLGRPHEFTAVAVLERSQPRDGSDPVVLSYAVRHLERFPPGTSYPDVFARLAERFAEPPLARSVLVADQTAVGKPVLDLLRRSRVMATVSAVAITTGHAAHRDERGVWLVPKQELVGTLQVLLQSGRLKVAEALSESSSLLREMETFRAEVVATPSDDVASWREREHDDLVLAVALAAWQGERQGPVSNAVPRVYMPASVWSRG